MSKIISFIIPSYNVEHCLENVLKSMLHENCLKETEIIVVNDGSQDRTAEIAERYVSSYPDSVKLINKVNGGHGSAINIGTEAVSGKYFKVIDADDWVLTDNLLSFIITLKQCNADVVLTPYHQVSIVSGKKYNCMMHCESYNIEYSMNEVLEKWECFKHCLTFHGITYKSSFYRRHYHKLPEKIFYEDQEYAAIPCCHASSIYPINLHIYQYLIDNGDQSVSDVNRVKQIRHVEQVTRNMLEYGIQNSELLPAGKEYLYRKEEEIILSYFVIACLIQEDKQRGRIDFKDYKQMIKEVEPYIYKRIYSKSCLYSFMNRIHLPYKTYQFIIRSKLYSLMRKKHRIERV